MARMLGNNKRSGASLRAATTEGQRKRPKQNNRRPQTRATQNLLDEEIDSEEEVEAREKGERLPQESDDDDGEDFFVEDAEDKRVRLAKSFLEKVGMGSKTDAEVAERLTLEAQISSKKVHYEVANQLSFGTAQFYRGHKDATTCVAPGSSDGTSAFTGSKDCSIIRWDVNTGQKYILPGKRKHFTCNGHFEQVLDLSVSSDGKVVLSVGQDRVVRLWDIRASCSPVDQLQGHTKTTTVGSWNSSRAMMGPFSSDRTDCYRRAMLFWQAVCAEPESDMDRFFTTSADLSLRVWHLGSRQCVETFYGHTQTPLCMDILARDRPVTGGADSSVRVWKVATQSHLIYAHHRQAVDAVTQLTATRTLSGDQEGSLLLWSVASRKPQVVVRSPHGGHWVTALGCVRYSDVAFSGSDDGFVRTWRIGHDDAKMSKLRTLAKPKKLPPVMVELADRKIPVVRRKARPRSVHENDAAAYTGLRTLATQVQSVVAGVVNQLATSANGQVLFAAIGREHKHGRWKVVKEARNGLLVVPVKSSSFGESNAAMAVLQ